ncbi:HEAT repeat domain-containing protein [Jidongwangia harbinensis]|uniref:HEAT repeat domain-containing protein n=1 Tax=Jidongwangia harbinensis TaxID=2878561 RepID=UPI001CD99A9A|nr:HEAT repeat domain-containing protein [Jidongwangia harbinensis]MCA2219367.1 HEAT repeat domain-containing protein [Jidongwangia harbinensis]
MSVWPRWWGEGTVSAAGPPRARIAEACDRRGTDDIVDGCLALLAGDDTDADLIMVLGGPAGPHYLDAPPEQRYWLRVWAARGLLWAPRRDRAAPAVCRALDDEAWRVREMAAKVVARHRVAAAFDALPPLLEDPTPRVRFAASRALRVLTGAGA